MSAASRVLSLSRNRQIVRAFADRPVPHELIARIVDCARYAPSAKEAQPWRFIVVRDAVTRHRLAAAAFNHHRPRERRRPRGKKRRSIHRFSRQNSPQPSTPVNKLAGVKIANSNLGLPAEPVI